MADRYLVATGNWNSTDTWSDETGGDPGASFPTPSDNVFLDANSGAAVLTVNVGSSCLNLDCTGFAGTLAGSGNITSSGTVFKLVSGMTYSHTGGINWNPPSGTMQVTTASKTLPGNVTINHFGTVQLQDDLTLGGSFQQNWGTFDPNGKKVTMTGGSPFLNATSSSTFYDLEHKPATAATSRSLTLQSNITVTNNLTLDSNSTDADKRLLITSNTRGTARTITCNGTVTANYCDFEDITGAGDADWDLSAATGGSGNCDGNTDITFTTAATVYQVGSGNNNFSADVWKTASGGATAARRPLPQDTAVLDANSTTGTMTQNLQRIGTISAAAFTDTLTPSTTCTCYGSITLGSGLTLTSNTNIYTLAGRGTHTLTSAEKTWGGKPIVVDAPGGSYTLQDAFTTTSSVTLTRGTFDANDFNVTCGTFFSSNSNTRTLSMGSGTWELTSTSTQWTTANATSLTLNKGTALIKCTAALTFVRTLDFGNLTFYDFENATTNDIALIIKGGPTFNQFKVNPGRKQQFYRNETVTATTWILEGTEANPIELSSDTTSAAIIAKAGGGTVVTTYATISYLNATPYTEGSVLTFYYDANSTVSNSTGWTAGAPPVPGTGLKIFGIQSPAKVNGVALPMKINGVTA